MALLIKSMIRGYHYVFTELADPRTNHWFLISDPLPGLFILWSWLYFVKTLGPKYMAKREPFTLKRILVFYNFFQVLLSLFVCYEGLFAAWLTTYSWTCEPVDNSTSPEAMRVARGVYIYFLAKITELLDTIFFVLRKKERQITFLHMYHHTVMPMISWGATKYYPGGHGTLIGVINSFVHIIMYSYYMLAAMGPGLRKYLFWKKYITTLQMLQFCIAFLHSSQLLFYDCGYPRWSVCLTLPNAIFFYFLFADFYNKAYDKGDGKKDKKMMNGHTNGALTHAYTNGKSNGMKMENGHNEISNNNCANKINENSKLKDV